MSDADTTHDTVVSRRHDATADDDTIESGRRGSEPVDTPVADTVLRSGEPEADATATGSRRRGTDAPDDVADDADRRVPAGRRDAYEPDAAALRAAVPVRPPTPVIVSRRTPPADSGGRPVRASVDRDSVERATRARARSRVVWLLIGCVAAAAGATTALVLLPL